MRDLRDRVRIAHPSERRGRAALLRPCRQQAREQGAAGAVGVLVEAETRTLDLLEQRLDQRLVGERLQVREMQRGARAARDLEHLVDRLEQALTLVADVRDDRPAELRRHLGDGDELVGVRVGAGQVDEPEREVRRAGLEARPHLPLHLLQLICRRGPALAADHRVAGGAVANRRHERDRRPRRVEGVEVLRERRPRPLVRPRPFQRAQVVAPLRPAARRDGRRRESVRADHLRGHALREHLGQERVVVRPQRRVRVHVDEAGAEPEAGRVDHVAGQPGSHRRDPPVRDAHVDLRRLALAGIDRGTADHEHQRAPASRSQARR